jgi:dTDP-4-amino-4,6-dideoxygalactose transaminase
MMTDNVPVRSVFLPFSRPTIGQAEIDEVVDSLRSGWLTTGPKVIRFENEFLQWSGSKEAIAVNSATAGLHLAVATLDLAPGDEVITTSITWPSTVNNIEICGVRPVFADVDRETLQIDPAEVEKHLSSRTRAVIPVHFAGAPCDLDPIKEICRSKGLSLIEDAAHAVGTVYRGRLVGSDSEFAVFSFHPIKNMTTGEGGMVLCNDTERAKRMRRLRFHGISRDAWKRYS